MSVDVTITAAGCCSGHNHQFTHNYTPALQAAGFPSWKFMDGLQAVVVSHFVSSVLEELRRHPAPYESMIRGAGDWGTMPTLLVSLEELLQDLIVHPMGEVRCH